MSVSLFQNPKSLLVSSPFNIQKYGEDGDHEEHVVSFFYSVGIMECVASIERKTECIFT